MAKLPRKLIKYGTKKFKPVTAGTRWRIGNAYAEITTDTPEKTLLEKITRTGGRNSQGRRAMRYIGGGHKKMYRADRLQKR